MLYLFLFPFFFHSLIFSSRREGILNKRKRHVEDKILREKKHIGKHQEGPKVENVTRLEKLKKTNDTFYHVFHVFNIVLIKNIFTPSYHLVKC